MIRGFLLNLDGTLLDSNEANVKAWEQAFQHFGYDITPDEIRTFMGMGGDKMLPALVPGLTVENGRGKELAEYRQKYFLEQIAPHIKPTPGARELLVAFKKNNMRLVVSTSAESKDMQRMLKTAGVDDLVDTFVTATDVKASKPAPDILTAALEKIQLSKDEVFMLGDTPYDIASAKKNGIETIALRSGGFSDEQLQGAIHIFDHPQDLLENLRLILGETSNIIGAQREFLELKN